MIEEKYIMSIMVVDYDEGYGIMKLEVMNSCYGYNY
jgi:hypothetical protein